MPTADGCCKRRERLWSALDEKPDWILVADPKHLTYFTGYFPSPYVFSASGGGAMLILGPDGSSVLVTDNLLNEFAEQAHVDEVVAPTWYRGVESAAHREAMLVESVLGVLQDRPGTHLGYERAQVASGVIEGWRANRGAVQLTPVDSTIHGLKRGKDPDELAAVCLSLRASDAAHAAALAEIRPGMTELDAYLVVQDAAMREAGDRVLVYGDFVSGPRCEDVGGPPTTRVIDAGDLVLLDFSVVVNGYRGDTANTFVCGGIPTDEQRRLYDACLEALHAGEAQIRPGRPCREVDQAVRASFGSKKLAESFDSHSGHGLGLGHPDPPYLVPESTDTLVAGDVIAIEPGQYIKGTAGMRYEHNYVVTADGFEQLSHHALQIDPCS